MAQLLAHNRCFSYPSIRDKDGMTPRWTRPVRQVQEEEPSPLHAALHQHHDQASPQANQTVEKLVDIVIFLHKQIRDAFDEAVPVGTDFMEQGHNKRLGSCGLPLHYANIINQTENIVTKFDDSHDVYHGCLMPQFP